MVSLYDAQEGHRQRFGGMGHISVHEVTVTIILLVILVLVIWIVFECRISWMRRRAKACNDTQQV